MAPKRHCNSNSNSYSNSYSNQSTRIERMS